MVFPNCPALKVLLSFWQIQSSRAQLKQCVHREHSLTALTQPAVAARDGLGTSLPLAWDALRNQGVPALEAPTGLTRCLVHREEGDASP